MIGMPKTAEGGAFSSRGIRKTISLPRIPFASRARSSSGLVGAIWNGPPGRRRRLPLGLFFDLTQEMNLSVTTASRAEAPVK
jgi:hypothetical protein